MRILHIGYFPTSPKTPNAHSVAVKLSNGLIRNGHTVLNFSDRDLARMYGFGHRRFGAKKANQALYESCLLHKPDLFLLGHADILTAETLLRIREKLPSLRIVDWNVDPLFLAGNVAALKAKLPAVDATLISTAGEALRPFVRPGGLTGFLPNPADPSIEAGRNDLKDRPEFDVLGAFSDGIRTVCGQDILMSRFADELEEALPEVNFSFFGVRGLPRKMSDGYQKLLESAAVGLNISRRADYFLYSSDRISQLAGNGLAVAIERQTGYNTLFGEDEMLFFSSREELHEKLQRFSRDTALRKKTASAGRRRYFELFNERRIAAYIIEAGFGTVNPGDYEWPTIVT